MKKHRIFSNACFELAEHRLRQFGASADFDQCADFAATIQNMMDNYVQEHQRHSCSQED